MLRQCVILSLIAGVAAADDHSHDTVVLPQAPSISRLKVSYAQPQAIAIDNKSNVYVADARAGVVLRTTPDGRTSVLADRLVEPIAVRVDESGDMFVATTGLGRTGAGRIYRVTAEGERETILNDITAPTDFLRNDTGALIVALKGDRILRVSPDGERETLCNEIKNPVALARGTNGELFIAASNGTVHQLLANGRLRLLAKDLKSPTDMAIKPDGRLVVTESESNRLTVIQRGGKAKQYAKVPLGTISVAFTETGNMVIANRETRSVTRIVSHMSIPCPHCDKTIPIRLKKPTPPSNSF